MADETVIVELDLVLNKGSVSKATTRLKGDLNKSGEEAGDSFSSGFLKSFAGNIAAIGFSKVLNGIKDTITGTVDAAKKLEVFETQFKTILGSSRAAQKQLQDLQNFAATTPFQIEGLALSTRQLLSFGVASGDVIPTLKQLGDLAAGTGSNIDELTIPFGRLISTQKLTLVELDKFADRGINIYAELAKQTGKSLAAIRDDISKGRVDFSEFTTALDNLTGAGGTFFNAAEAQSKTLAGTLSTLKDNIFNLQGVIGKTFKDILITLVGAATRQIQTFTKFISDNRVQIATSFIEIGHAINDFVIAPLELLSNVGAIVFNSLKVGLQTIVFGFAKLGTNIGGVLNTFGVVSDEALANLQTFAESSEQLLGEFSETTRESVDNIFDGSVFSSGDEFLTNLQENVTGANAILETLGGDGKSVVKTALGDKEEVESFFSGFLASQEEFTKASAKKTKDLGRAFASFGQNAKKAIGQGLGQGFAAFGKALADGENAFDAFVKSFLSSLGQMMIQQGTAFILQGLGFSVIPGLQASGGSLVATGAALATFGGALSALSGGGGASGSSAAPASASSVTGGGEPVDSGIDATFNDEENSLQAEKVTNITVEGLIGGLDLINIINDAADEQDVKLNVSLA